MDCKTVLLITAGSRACISLRFLTRASPPTRPQDEIPRDALAATPDTPAGGCKDVSHTHSRPAAVLYYKTTQARENKKIIRYNYYATCEDAQYYGLPVRVVMRLCAAACTTVCTRDSARAGGKIGNDDDGEGGGKKRNVYTRIWKYVYRKIRRNEKKEKFRTEIKRFYN